MSEQEQRPTQDQLDRERAEGEGMVMSSFASQTESAPQTEVPPAPQRREQTDTPGQQPEHTAIPENKEAAIDHLMSPTVSRFFALHENDDAFDPDEAISESEAKIIAEEKMHEKPSTAEVAANSHEARAKQATGVTRDSWKSSMEAEITKWKETSDAEPILATLKSLHVDTDEDLKPQLEEFRKTYVPSKKDYPNDSQAGYQKRLEAGIEQFAKDIADGCRDEETGAIDFQQFDTRLQASHELLAIFGTKDNVNMEIKQYATAYALADKQTSTDEKTLIQKSLETRLQQPITDPEDRQMLTHLNEAHKKLGEETTQPEPESESPQTEQDPESGKDDREPLEEEEIKKRIDAAKEEAFSKEEETHMQEQIKNEIEALRQKQQVIDEKKAQGQETQQEEHDYEEEKEEIKSKTNFETHHRGRIHLINADELKTALQYHGASQDEIGKLLEQFTERFKELEQQKRNPEYLLKFNKKDDGEISYSVDLVAEQPPILTKSRLGQIVNQLVDFANKQNLSEEDEIQVEALFDEYLKDIYFAEEEEYKEALKDRVEPEVLQEYINRIKDEYDGNDPDIGYATRQYLTDNGQPAIDPKSPNEELLAFRRNEQLAEIVARKLFPQAPSEEVSPPQS